jgi:hypothetical protein
MAISPQSRSRDISNDRDNSNNRNASNDRDVSNSRITNKVETPAIEGTPAT